MGRRGRRDEGTRRGEGGDAAPCADREPRQAVGGARRRPQQNSQRVLLAITPAITHSKFARPYSHAWGARPRIIPAITPPCALARAPWCGPVAVGRDAWPPGLPARAAAPSARCAAWHVAHAESFACRGSVRGTVRGRAAHPARCHDRAAIPHGHGTMRRDVPIARPPAPRSCPVAAPPHFCENPPLRLFNPPQKVKLLPIGVGNAPNLMLHVLASTRCRNPVEIRKIGRAHV